MFDEDGEGAESAAPIFNRNDDYGGRQRTNQREMDELMKPCLDYDDDGEEDDLGLLLGPTLAAEKDPKDDPVDYGIEKYFSNGDVDRGGSGSAVFSKRVGKRSNMRRYSDDADDLVGAAGPGND